MLTRETVSVYRLCDDPCDTIREMYRLTQPDGSLHVAIFDNLLDYARCYRMQWTATDCEAVCREYRDLREKLERIALRYADYEAGNLAGEPEELIRAWNTYAKPVELGLRDSMDLDDVGAILMSWEDIYDKEGCRRLGKGLDAGRVILHSVNFCKWLAQGTSVQYCAHELAQSLAIYRFGREITATYEDADWLSVELTERK